MRDRIGLSGPVVISGVGGSGTRLVTKIFMNLGCYMGSDLNSSNDNLWFTLLFKRPKWFKTLSNNRNKHIFKGLDILTKAMTGFLSPLPDELDFIMSATVEMADSGHDHLGSGQGGWAVKRAWNMLRSQFDNYSAYVRWGWKEPNTHIYVSSLNEYFANLKYIHVIRHGLDMAYSHNQAQLFNWGQLFGVEIPQSSEMLPVASLKYWIRANQKVIMFGKRMGRERFYLLNFERLCSCPQLEITKLIKFLDLDIHQIDIDKLCHLPQTPESMGRYKEYDLSIFDHESINAVCQLGFTI